MEGMSHRFRGYHCNGIWTRQHTCTDVYTGPDSHLQLTNPLLALLMHHAQHSHLKPQSRRRPCRIGLVFAFCCSPSIYRALWGTDSQPSPLHPPTQSADHMPNWRSSQSFWLNNFISSLKYAATNVNITTLLAQDQINVCFWRP